jgi:hypothetical protein
MAFENSASMSSQQKDFPRTCISFPKRIFLSDMLQDYARRRQVVKR